MPKLGRPPSLRAASARVIHIKLRLYPGEDDDLIAFFDSIIPRLRAVRVKQALRSGINDSQYRDYCEDEKILDALDILVT
ncbi:MAG: hypothetical protein ACYCZF_12290 [Anaerolineae bacterium]